MSSADGSGPRAPTVISAVAALLSAGLAIVFVAAYVRYASLLALSQAADSSSDVLTASVLLWAAKVGAAPADRSHPHGHHQAEPIAALVVAVLTGVMAVELLRTVVSSLAGDLRPQMTWPLLVAFISKIVLKAGLASVSLAFFRRQKSAALEALFIDARNDVLVGLLAVAGYFGARYGSPQLDAWLAIPVSFWIAWSGIELARSNIRIIMGESAGATRHEALAQLVSSVEHVRSQHNLVARHHGNHLDVTVHVVLDERLSLREAHSIGENVERVLIGEPDVARAIVHVDVESDVESDD